MHLIYSKDFTDESCIQRECFKVYEERRSKTSFPGMSVWPALTHCHSTFKVSPNTLILTQVLRTLAFTKDKKNKTELMTYLKSQLQTKHHHKQSLGFRKTLTGSSTKFNLKFYLGLIGKDHSHYDQRWYAWLSFG